MDPKELRLPFSNEAFQLNPALEKIWRILWSVDPAKLQKISPEVIDKLVQIDLNYTVASAKLTAQMKSLEAETLDQINTQIANTKILTR